MSKLFFKCPQCWENLTAEEDQVGASMECTGCHSTAFIRRGDRRQTCECGEEMAFGSGIKSGSQVRCPRCDAPVLVAGAAAAGAASADEDAPSKLRLRKGGSGNRLCSGCGAVVSGDAVICTQCGLDFRTGRRIRVNAPRFLMSARIWLRILIWGALVGAAVAYREEIKPHAIRAVEAIRAWVARTTVGEDAVLAPEPPPAAESPATPQSDPSSPAPVATVTPVSAVPQTPAGGPTSAAPAGTDTACSACLGSGRGPPVACTACVCKDCSGRRVVPCAACGGRRGSVCPDCNGNKFGPDKELKSACPKCHGSGTVRDKVSYTASGLKRTSAKPQSVPCTTCKGKGIVVQVERTYCERCKGSGEAACGECGGKGVTPCRNCAGTGWSGSCRVCGGTRQAVPPCAVCGGSGRLTQTGTH